MNEIIELTKIDYSYVFISIVTILLGVKIINSIFEWIIEKTGIETKWSLQKKEQESLLIKTSQALTELEKKHNNDMKRSDISDNELRSNIQNLTNLFIDKIIDDWRWEILDFASALSNGRIYNREAFDHIIKIYHKYEEVLKERGLENGLIDESMKFVMEKYREYLEKGVWK